MAVVKQKPLINDTVLQLAEEAAVGDVFIYSNNEYQWTPRSEAWTGVMLTKTERGFELIDNNGRSHGIVNLGEPYHNVDPTPACTACDKAYVWQNAVAEITAVCCDQELYVGKASENGWSVDWQEFPPPLEPPVYSEESYWIVVSGNAHVYIAAWLLVADALTEIEYELYYDGEKVATGYMDRVEGGEGYELQRNALPYVQGENEYSIKLRAVKGTETSVWVEHLITYKEA